MRAFLLLAVLAGCSAQAADYQVEAINDASAARLISYIEINQGDVIRLYFNSPGGSLDAMYDILRAMERGQRNGTRFVCTAELAASAGAAIYSSCDVRLALPRALFLIHPASTTANGNAEEIKQIADQLEAFTNAYLRHTGRFIRLPFAELKRRALRQYWFDAGEAVEIGFVHEILR